jgi:hypothetical protein
MWRRPCFNFPLLHLSHDELLNCNYEETSIASRNKETSIAVHFLFERKR